MEVDSDVEVDEVLSRHNCPDTSQIQNAQPDPVVVNNDIIRGKII